MQFGYIDTNLDEIDFALPVDGEVTKQTLNGLINSQDFKIYVGGTKWTNKSWKGLIYPADISDKQFLSYYAKNFNAIEFGSTFYAIPSSETIANWTKQIEENKDFKFCPKFPRSITQIRKLINAGELTGAFYDGLQSLEGHLGVLLLQLPEAFSPNLINNLRDYIKTLPPDKKVAVEVRHKDWYEVQSIRKELLTLLKDYNIGTVISDTTGRRDMMPMELTTKDAVIRFVGNNLHATDFTRIDAWVDRLYEWQQRGLQSIWFFIHQHDEICTPKLCDYLIEKLNIKLGTIIPRPNLI